MQHQHKLTAALSRRISNRIGVASEHRRLHPDVPRPLQTSVCPFPSLQALQYLDSPFHALRGLTDHSAASGQAPGEELSNRKHATGPARHAATRAEVTIDSLHIKPSHPFPRTTFPSKLSSSIMPSTLSKFFASLTSSGKKDKPKTTAPPPTNHPAVIDWTKWSPPGPGDGKVFVFRVIELI